VDNISYSSRQCLPCVSMVLTERQPKVVEQDVEKTAVAESNIEKSTSVEEELLVEETSPDEDSRDVETLDDVVELEVSL